MKDLKHLIYFERLLENADNELIEKKKADGGICLGYTCFHIPEVLLNVDTCFSTRLRAPNTGSIDIATYYMSNYTCEYARALLERAIEGGYKFLDALIGVDACSMMNRSMEHFEILQVNDKVPRRPDRGGRLLDDEPLDGAFRDPAGQRQAELLRDAHGHALQDHRLHR